MRASRSMSVQKFERIHKDLEVRVCAADKGIQAVAMSRPGNWLGGTAHAVSDVVSSAEYAIWQLSRRCSALARREALDRTGWQDSNTGATGIPLSAHHKVKRSKGRDDSPDNLAPLGLRSHGKQHEQ